ncbi:MAG: hypothetical protein KAV48_02165 [Methanomicrobia archaeon]|nr:hypothetical protein [Methanomicrobia archaeon]MCK4432716.1 hypothetical protein [Methanomicrobia archaeon]MCK4637396.1 hypothetical protein [Methanomicrobia archaeon]
MFGKRKKEVMFKLAEAVAENKVDSEILETLTLINSQKEYYTTSSCAGRIVLIWMPDLGDKKRSVFLGKWHRKIEYEELIESLEFRDSGVIFLISQSPIIHVASCDLKSAIKIRDLAFSCGFKNSGIKSITKKIVVEILSTERIDVPLGEKQLLVNEEYLRFLVKYANKALERSRKKLKKLNKNLEESL